MDITGAPSNWWVEWEALRNMGQVAPFGAATYGAFILPPETGVRAVFWAIQQVVNDRVRWREEGLKEGRKEGREEGRKEGREEGREEGRKEGREEGREEGRKEGREEGREQRDEELIRQAEALGEIMLGNVRLRVVRDESSSEETGTRS